jgi:hypothetical protein
MQTLQKTTIIQTLQKITIIFNQKNNSKERIERINKENQVKK